MQTNQTHSDKKAQLAALFQQKGLEMQPITDIQSNIWFQSHLNSDLNIAYNLRRGFLITGPLDVEKLQRSITRMIAKHAALRTTFVAVAGSPVKLVKSEVTPFELIIERLSSENDLTSQLEQAADSPFDFGSEPLFRLRLFKVDDHQHALLMVVHHIICDGVAIDLMIREISSGYVSETRSMEIPDQKAVGLVTAKTPDHTLDYWKKSLQHFPKLHNLPLDRPRPAELSYVGEKVTHTFSKELSNEINAYCGQQRLTPFMALLSVWTILLSKISAEQKVVVGFPLSTRDEDNQNHIDLLVDTLPLGIDISPDSSFEAHAKSVRSRFLEAYENRNISFYELSEHLKPDRNLAYHPVYQLAFTFLENKQQLTLENTQVEELPLSKSRIKMDLEFHVELDQYKNYRCNVHYNTELFNGSTIARYIRRFMALAKTSFDQPGQLIKELPITDPKEDQQLLQFATGRRLTLPKFCIHQVFEQLLPSVENKVALIYKGQHLSYGALNKQANQLAHCLIEKAKNESFVGLFLNQGLETIIGMLGVMKSGKAYIPIDPSYPEKRVNYILENSGISTLVTNDSQRKPNVHQTIIFKDCIDYPKHNPDVNTTVEDLIYMIYTSGTTGVPKGVPISHKGILNYTWSKIDQQNIDQRDIALQLMSFSFDGFGCEAFPSLLTGGTLVLVDKLSDMDLDDISQVITSNHVTRFMAVPSMLKLIFDRFQTKDLETLHTISLGGEKPDQELLAKITDLKSDLRLYNEYGPTENSIASTAGTLVTDAPENIGVPMANSIAVILDKSGLLTPVGVTGELCVGGPGLTSGYFQNPDLTASRFFNSQLFTEERLYRTGDLAKWDAEGNVIFLGRSDDQVKVNGVRIELEEIRQTLLDYPYLTDCLVLSRGNSLQAIIQKAKDHSQLDVEDISAFLRDRLPHYMIPGAFRTIDHFPVTTHGKIDVEQLQKQSIPLIKPEQGPEKPHNEITTRLKSAWSKVLKIEPAEIDAKSNFFDLGGHSLLLGKLVTLINKETDFVIDKVDFFKYPTIQSMVQAKAGDRPSNNEIHSKIPNRAEIRKNQRNKRLKRQQ